MLRWCCVWCVCVSVCWERVGDHVHEQNALRVSIQNVPVYASNTRKRVSTCARACWHTRGCFERTHGRFSACHTTTIHTADHTTDHTTDTTRNITHNITRRQRRKRPRKTEREKTKEKTREETREETERSREQEKMKRKSDE